MTTLLVATTGGHLKQLHRLLPRLEACERDVIWVTHDTVQSRHLLSGYEVWYVPYQAPRDFRRLATNMVTASRFVKRPRFTRAISTGAGVALAFLPIAKSKGISAHYIESATRVSGPSLTGKLLARVPGIHCYTQHEAWANSIWQYRGSVLEGFSPITSEIYRPITRAVVVLGTAGRGFRQLLERLVSLLADVDTLWQTGHTDVSGLPIDPVPWVHPGKLANAMRRADVVVSHAGTGTALDALEGGKCPVLVPRRKESHEHVDDHQVQLARELDRRGLALCRFPEQLSHRDLVAASSRRVKVMEPVAPFNLS